MAKFTLGVALALCVSSLAQAADLPSPAAPSTPIFSAPAASGALYDPTKFEIRGGYLNAPFGTETGTSDVTAALVFPKFVNLPGWQDLLIPRLRIGGVANLSGGTSYVYADGLWTANYDRVFAEIFFGGLVHNGPLTNYVDNNATALGCRELYHLGADLGYRIDQHWSVIATFEHGSNGEPVLSNCPQNRGLNVAGVSIGYAF
jgi:opacity protein-like surface antigen